MRNRPTFATSFAAFSEARPDLTQLAGKLLMKMDNSSYVSTPSRPYARSDCVRVANGCPKYSPAWLRTHETLRASFPDRRGGQRRSGPPEGGRLRQGRA